MHSNKTKPYSALMFLLVPALLPAQDRPSVDGYDLQVREVIVTRSVIDAAWVAANRQAALHQTRTIDAPKGKKLLAVVVSFKKSNAANIGPARIAVEKSRNLFNPKSIGHLAIAAFDVAPSPEASPLARTPLTRDTSTVAAASPLAGTVTAIALDRKAGRTTDSAEPEDLVIRFNKDFSSGLATLLYVVPPDFDSSAVTVRFDSQIVPRRPRK